MLSLLLNNELLKQRISSIPIHVDDIENFPYDDYTLEINLKSPQPSFIYQLCLPYGSIVPSEVVDFYKEDFSQLLLDMVLI